MSDNLEEMLEQSEEEWAEIDKKVALREKKDKKIISMYCAENRSADVFNIIELLEKYNGMPDHDSEIVQEFKAQYPKMLKVKTLKSFMDIQLIYHGYLDSGGESDE